MMQPKRLLPEIRTQAKIAILTGNPERIPQFIAALGSPQAEWRAREISVHEVASDSSSLLIACHGQGGYPTALLAEELFDSGVSTMIRVGSCGAMQAELGLGTVILPTGSVRDDGASASYLPIEVPAVPDSRLLRALCQSLEHAGLGYELGLAHCKDAYYSQDPRRFLAGRPWPERYAMLKALGVLATEAELASLLAVATVRRFRAAAVLVVGAASDRGSEVMIQCVRAAAEAARTA